MQDYEGKDEERKDFKYVHVPNYTKKHISKIPINNSYVRRILVELPLMITSITTVILIYGGLRYVGQENKENKAVNVGSGVLNAVAMIIFMTVFKKIARVVTNWENHRF